MMLARLIRAFTSTRELARRGLTLVQRCPRDLVLLGVNGGCSGESILASLAEACGKLVLLSFVAISEVSLPLW